MEEKKESRAIESENLEVTFNNEVDSETPFPFQFTDSLLRSWNASPDRVRAQNNASALM